LLLSFPPSPPPFPSFFRGAHFPSRKKEKTKKRSFWRPWIGKDFSGLHHRCFSPPLFGKIWNVFESGEARTQIDIGANGNLSSFFLLSFFLPFFPNCGGVIRPASLRSMTDRLQEPFGHSLSLFPPLFLFFPSFGGHGRSKINSLHESSGGKRAPKFLFFFPSPPFFLPPPETST